MSITDELREWAGRSLYYKERRDELTAIADRIDKEHAEAVADALQLRGGEDRWVKLPVDADGVPIHVGDEMEYIEKVGAIYGKRYFGKVETMSYERFDTILRWEVDGEPPSDLCHVKHDSWERIIGDAANLVRGDNESVVELVERCRRLEVKHEHHRRAAGMHRHGDMAVRERNQDCVHSE